MGRAGYDTTDPASYRSAAAYNAIAMHRAQRLIEQEVEDDRTTTEKALAKAARQKKGANVQTNIHEAEHTAKKARLDVDDAAATDGLGKDKA